MAELVNNFSWSISAQTDFGECPRRRYWAKYAMWGGWNESATPLQRTAYRLAKMENRFSLQGNAVEKAVMWILRQAQEGRRVTVDEAYEAAARPYLNLRWSDSKAKRWQANPKRHCCLHEHYYPDHHHTPEPEMVARLMAQIKLCTARFIDTVLPRVGAIRRDQEVPVATADMGDPESFPLDSVKIYAIPDYTYRAEGELHIHDWKSGSPRDSHQAQMGVYGLWASRKLGLPAGQIHVHLEYLPTGETRSATLGEAQLEASADFIRQSVADMAAYLVDGDLRRNQPLTVEHWELSADPHVCQRCNYYELCKPELLADEAAGP